MNGNKDCANYLLEKQVRRVMLELKKKWISYGKVTGTIKIMNPTKQEKEDLTKILGKYFDKEDIEFKAKELEEALQKSKFAPIDIKDVLECYFGEEIFTAKEKAQLKQEEEKKFYILLMDILKKRNVEEELVSVIENAFLNKDTTYRILMNIRKEEEKKSVLIFENVIKGIQKVMTGLDSLVPIAIFSATISGNPHFLDKGTDGSNLFVSILSSLKETNIPTDTKSYYEFMEEVGLLKDEIAGSIAVYNIHFKREEGFHLGAEECYKYKQPFLVSYKNLEDVLYACTDNQKAYVVENEMVFSDLQNKIHSSRALICTSGQLSTTAKKVIELLVKGNTKIYYSGDFDPEGLGICDRLWKKNPDNIFPWFMDEKTYKTSISKETISENRLNSLNKIENEILKNTAKVLMKEKKAGYQENVMDLYLEDILDTK